MTPKTKLKVYRCFGDPTKYHQNIEGTNPWSENPDDVLMFWTYAEVNEARKLGKEIELVDWQVGEQVPHHIRLGSDPIEKALREPGVIKEPGLFETFFPKAAAAARAKEAEKPRCLEIDLGQFIVKKEPTLFETFFGGGQTKSKEQATRPAKKNVKAPPKVPKHVMDRIVEEMRCWAKLWWF